MTTAAQIVETLALTESGDQFIGNCPCCSYERAFSLREENERLLVHCHVGCTQQEVINALWEYGLWPAPNAAALFGPPVLRAAPPPKPDSTEAALQMWHRSQPAEGTVVEKYLRARGYRGPIPPALRYVTAKHQADQQFHPIMIAAVIQSGKTSKITGVHRTFLLPDGSGKADLEPAKMTLGKVGGAGVPLADPGPKLAVSEGIETGLSVQQATGIPTWAALSTGGMTKLVLPEIVKDVYIAADPDPAGMKAAESAAYRWFFQENRRPHIIKPPEGMDFNDLARKS